MKKSEHYVIFNSTGRTAYCLASGPWIADLYLEEGGLVWDYLQVYLHVYGGCSFFNNIPNLYSTLAECILKIEKK